MPFIFEIWLIIRDYDDCAILEERNIDFDSEGKVLNYYRQCDLEGIIRNSFPAAAATSSTVISERQRA